MTPSIKVWPPVVAMSSPSEIAAITVVRNAKKQERFMIFIKTLILIP
jgi:hypothetical protein